MASKFLNTPEKVRVQSKKSFKKAGNAKDIAKAAVYLVIQKSSWVTGQVRHVDGGFSNIKQK